MLYSPGFYSHKNTYFTLKGSNDQAIPAHILSWNNWLQLCGSWFCLARTRDAQPHTITERRCAFTRTRVPGLSPCSLLDCDPPPRGQASAGPKARAQNPFRLCFRVPGTKELPDGKGLSPFFFCLSSAALEFVTHFIF